MDEQIITKKKKNPFRFFFRHKIFCIIITAGLVGGVYYYFSSQDAGAGLTNYALAAVEKSSVISIVSGSGQVYSVSQVDVLPKASAVITALNVKAGQAVKAGDILAELDPADLEGSVDTAMDSLKIAQANLGAKLAGPTADEMISYNNSLESARIAYQNSLDTLEDTKAAMDGNTKRAEIQYENSKLSYESAQRAYNESLANQDVEDNQSKQNLDNAYINARTALAGTLSQMRSAIMLADGILGFNDYSSSDRPYAYLLGALDSQTLTDANNSYNAAKSQFDDFQNSYETTDWDDHTAIENLLNQAPDALRAMHQLSHDVYMVLINTVSATSLTQNTLDSYRSSASSYESAMLSAMASMQTATQNITNANLDYTAFLISGGNNQVDAESALQSAENNFTSAQSTYEQSLLDIKESLDSAESDVVSKKMSLENAQAQYNANIAPPREVDVAPTRIQVEQAQKTYDKAVGALDYAHVRAPFDGIVATVSQAVGDSASPSAPLLTIISPAQTAVVSLNEVDAARVHVAQKVTLTFSAIDELTITGVVEEIDSIGTVSQGVVSYSVKITFDMQDERIKSQMSVSADIVSDARMDVLVVPNAAVKSDQSGQNYVEVIDTGAASSSAGVIATKNLPQQKAITVGLVDDTNTEITSGLSQGEFIVVSTMSDNSASAGARSASGMSAFGGAEAMIR
ncbi:MAG: HlyD family efflux transporter periplasmic adaptor subunit [Patescibacteria group bacterium]|nr:HlyD family efflux transporter periplasmic adaptor subunit [Patescibacteria group bacterium]